LQTVGVRSRRSPDLPGLQDLFIFGSPGRVDNAQKNQIIQTEILNPLDTGRWDFNRVPGLDLGGLVVHMHQPTSTQDIVNFVGFEAVTAAFSTRLYDRVSQGIAPAERIIAIGMEQFTQASIIAGDKFGTLRESADTH
jgi:hypothetical protein